MDTYQVYTGFWDNYSFSDSNTSQWTLTVTAGGFLLSAVATYITIVGSEFWSIVAFVTHQCRAKPGPHDGIHHVHQAVYRNSSALGSAWTLFTVNVAYSGRKAWYWPRRRHEPYTDRRLPRTIPGVLLPLAVWGVFVAAAPLSSLITSKAYKGNEVKLQARNCGFLTWNQDSTGIEASERYTIDAAQQALAYVDQCYNTTDTVACYVLPQQRLLYGVTQISDCPFANRCKVPPITMETDWMDSHVHFGINTPKADRVQLRRQTTCAVVDVDDLTKKVPVYNGSIDSHEYYLGPIQGTSDFTSYALERLGLDTAGYQIQQYYSYQGQSRAVNAWEPIADFNSTNGDVSLFVISFGTIAYQTPVLDPLFSTGPTADDDDRYNPSDVAGLLSCVDHYQLRPATSPNSTSNLGSITQTIRHAQQMDLSDTQLASALRLLLPSIRAGMYDAVNGLGTAALRAQRTVFGAVSTGLPSTQWQDEVRGWFETTLALLQRGVVAYASKPDAAVREAGATLLRNPVGSAAQAIFDRLCTEQRIRNVARYQTFSVTGLLVIFWVGLGIVFVALAQDTLADHVPALRGRVVRWRLDSLLHLQRLAFQNAEQGEWERCTESVPAVRGLLEFRGLDGETPGYVAVGDKLDEREGEGEREGERVSPLKSEEEAGD